jgi:hypothetical protein
MRHSVGYGYAVKKFNGGLTDFQRRRRHKNSTRRVDEIRRRRGLAPLHYISFAAVFLFPAVVA